MNHTVGDGILPKKGRVERSHPSTSPAMSAPPAVDRVKGTPPSFQTRAPISAPVSDSCAYERNIGDVGLTDLQHLAFSGGGGSVLYGPRG